MRSHICRTAAWIMAIAMMIGSVYQPAMASTVSTEQLLADTRVSAQQQELRSFIDRDVVRSQLVARGVDVEDAKQRIDAMSPSELSMLHERIDQLPAGEGALETVVFILVIFLLLDIAGVTDIFPNL